MVSEAAASPPRSAACWSAPRDQNIDLGAAAPRAIAQRPRTQAPMPPALDTPLHSSLTKHTLFTRISPRSFATNRAPRLIIVRPDPRPTPKYANWRIGGNGATPP